MSLHVCKEKVSWEEQLSSGFRHRCMFVWEHVCWGNVQGWASILLSHPLFSAPLLALLPWQHVFPGLHPFWGLCWQSANFCLASSSTAPRKCLCFSRSIITPPGLQFYKSDEFSWVFKSPFLFCICSPCVFTPFERFIYCDLNVVRGGRGWKSWVQSAMCQK